jgi:membrane-associated phospholipid phosphatase
MSFKTIYTKSKVYLISFLLIFMGFTFFLAYYGKAKSFILLNPYHSKWLDLFVSKFTFLGDGLFVVVLAVILFFTLKTQRLSILILISYIVSGLLAQILKHSFNAPRPKVFFNTNAYQHFIDGVSIANRESFPSGHTTSAFALAYILAYSTNKKSYQIILLLLAVAAGYSRIYLGQHFLTDVLFGAFLGTFISALTIFISNKVAYRRPLRFGRG